MSDYDLKVKVHDNKLKNKKNDCVSFYLFASACGFIHSSEKSFSKVNKQRKDNHYVKFTFL
jgi:hypothetical protein